MSAAVITEAFEQWKAQQAATGQAVVLDEFVFANVPNLDVDAPIDRAAGLPDAAHVVHRQAVGKTGLVNENAVVYSVTLGADVGDFSFNWIGLVSKAAGTLAMVVHAPVQSKVKNASGQQGNVLTRSFLMEYNGAQTQTLISTPAETWQIDFTARLAGMDEALRLANVDVYGMGAFFDSGFMVAKTGNQYFVTAGVGYIGGLRAALAANTNITVTTKPMKVWADVSYHGTLTSAYQTDIAFTLATDLADYTQSGMTHYVFALASIDANGVITDLRPKGSSQYLRKDKNLAEIADPAAALNTLNGVPKTRMVNKKSLTGDIDLSPADVGALPAGGTAVAATKLETARKISGVAFDGTQDISLGASDVGALPITGGTVTGLVKALRFATQGNPNASVTEGGTYIGYNETGGYGESDIINNSGNTSNVYGGFLFRTIRKPDGVETGRTRIGGNGDFDTTGTVKENGQRVFSPNNTPPYPVTSVNGQTGAARTSLASLDTRGWFKDEYTGKLEQWGTWSRTGDVTWIVFPVAFAVGSFNIQLTLIGNTSGGSGSNICVLDGTMNASSFAIFARTGESGGFWRAVGR